VRKIVWNLANSSHANSQNTKSLKKRNSIKRAFTMMLIKYEHKTTNSNPHTINMKDNGNKNNNTHRVFRLPPPPPLPTPTRSLPTFRAMAMVAGAESRLFRSPSVDANKQSSTFGKLPHPGLASGSDIFRDSEVTTHDDGDTSLYAAGTTIGQAGWQNTVLTRLGLYHPLEQCHTTFPKQKLPEVLSNLTNAFQMLSLQTVLVDSPIAANCISLEQVHWRVSMWESRIDSDTCIVEVQRCKGDVVTFVRYAKQIIAIVAQAVTATEATATPVLQPPMRTPSMPTLVQAERMLAHTFSSQQQRDEETQLDDSATIFYKALEIADGLIGADRFDARCLGLESLGIMTDPEKTGIAGASLVSSVVLTGRAPRDALMGNVNTADIAVYQRLQRAVVTAVATGNSNSKSMEQNVDSMDLDNDNNHISYHLALVICANAVSVLSSSQDAAENQHALEQFLADAEHLTGGCNLLECLVEQVHACQEQAHLAYLAARILHGLCQACPVARDTLMKQKVAIQVVQHAQQVGSVTHAALEDITGQLLVALHA
jgi:hypothetical protein